MVGAGGESLHVFAAMGRRLGPALPHPETPEAASHTHGSLSLASAAGYRGVRAAVLPSPGIEPGHLRGPHPTDDTPLPSAMWAGPRRSGRRAGGRQRGSEPVVRRHHATDVLRGDGPAGAQHAAVAHRHAARGEDMVQEPAETRQDVEGGGARTCPAGLAGGASDGAGLECDATAVGEGHGQDRRGQRRPRCRPLGRGVAVPVPGSRPDLRRARRPESGWAPVCCADGAGERRQGLDGPGEGGA